MKGLVQAVRVDSIPDAIRARHRGAFKYWARGDRPAVADEAEGRLSAIDGLIFVCPGCGELGGLNFGGGGWTWDGNEDEPTCAPSILHDVRTCGWHGHLMSGWFQPL